jgi:hypothetical protein
MPYRDAALRPLRALIVKLAEIPNSVWLVDSLTVQVAVVAHS